jgi:hypothetical protein
VTGQPRQSMTGIVFATLPGIAKGGIVKRSAVVCLGAMVMLVACSDE